MRIALVGAHNTGKTSLYNELYRKVELADHTFFPEVIREIVGMGFNINEVADDASQLAMCSLHLNHLKWNDMVTDRCLLDNLVYAWVLASGEEPTVTMDCVRFIDHYFLKHKDDYDLYVYCPIAFDMEDDGLRTTNREFQLAIDRTFIYMLQSIPENKILRVSGETPDRVQQVLNKIKEIGND